MDFALKLHELFNKQARYCFSPNGKQTHPCLPFDDKQIPKNGIYIIFENGETVQGMARIVRVGTHTGNNQLRSRLKQHFINKNKNRSIFRKNIGRCFLAQENPEYLPIWELDITPRPGREEKLKKIAKDYENNLEEKISEYIQNNLSFCVFEAPTKDDRLYWESKIISTLAKSSETKPSDTWLGNHSTKLKIRQSGLWQVNSLNNECLDKEDFELLSQLVQQTAKPNEMA